jgi:DNA phosphorothioation-associated putative methyltransferase
LLAKKGLSYDGQKLIEKKLSKPSTESHSVKIFRHKTAITRYDFSRPIKTLIEHNLLTEATTLLDYGCGQGDDVNGLKKMNFPVFGWDPVFYPNEKRDSADIVNLGFVLNVIEDPIERIKTLKEAFSLSNKLLVVSTLSANTGIPETGRPYKDGLLTSKIPSKYYFQDELQQFIEDSLDISAIAVGLAFYVFRSPVDHRNFLLIALKSY